MGVHEHIALFVISFAANLLSAMAGGGAGLLQLPALIFLGLPFSAALVTHKIASVALGFGATIKHRQKSITDARFLLLLLLSGIPGVILGASLILQIPEKIAQLSLGLLTMLLGLYSFVKKSLGQTAKLKNTDVSGLILGGLGLFFLGVLNGSLTSGTGLFVTIWLVTFFGFDYKKAVAYTMVLVGIFWNGIGALTLALQTPVAWSWLPALILGSLLGGYAGTAVAIKYGNPLIKLVFEIITILVGGSLIYSSMR